MYARQGRSEDAIHELDLAIEKDPTRYDSALLLGNLLIQARRLDAAEQVLRGALEQAPENPGVNEALARTLLMEDSDAAGVAEAAHLALTASRATNFEHASAIVTLAQALAAQQRYDRAIALLNKARGTPEIQTNPKLQRRILRLIRQYQKPAGAGASEG